MPPISSISIERDCNGCPTGSMLVLRRDGQASLITTGKARLGTVDQRARGHVSSQDFESLVQVLQAQGYFALDERYEDADIQDGTWSTISVRAGGIDKRVFKREDAGPAALKMIESAINTVKARIAFVPEP